MNQRRIAIIAGCWFVVLGFAANVRGQHNETRDSDEIRPAEQDDTPREDHPVTSSDDSEKLKRAAEMIVSKTNEFRRRHELAAVKPAEALDEAAAYFARYMARTGKYGHTADDQRPSQRAKQHGYDFCIVSENIAYVYRSQGFDAASLAKHFVEGWIDSEEHRENMLEEYVSDIGTAVARDDKTGHYFSVQMFGQPKSAAIRFTVVNKSGRKIDYQLLPAGEQEGRSLTLEPRMAVRHTRCRPPRIQLKNSQSGPIDVTAADTFIVRKKKQGVELTRKAADRSDGQLRESVRQLSDPR